MLASGKLSRDDLEPRIKEFVGKPIMLPSYGILADCGNAMNYACPAPDGENRLMVTATNKGGFKIHAFVYIQLKDKFDLASHAGEQGVISGNIDSIQLSPPTAVIWMMRIMVSGGVVEVETPPQQQANLN